ncbi:MAG: hypothetical protein QXQ77_01815 [Candidatus Aenigmatarchaeota archaeon]
MQEENIEKILRKISRYVKLVEEETQATLEFVRINFLVSGASLLQMLKSGKINEEEFNEAWEKLKIIYRISMYRPILDYEREIENAIFKEKDKIIRGLYKNLKSKNSVIC